MRWIVSAVMDDGGFDKACRDIADFAMHLGHDVALWIGDSASAHLSWTTGAPGASRLRIEHRRPFSYSHDECGTARLGRSLAVGDDGGDALTDEAQRAIEHQRIERIVARIFVPRRREMSRRRVLVGQHRADAGYGERRRLVDVEDVACG